MQIASSIVQCWRWTVCLFAVTSRQWRWIKYCLRRSQHWKMTFKNSGVSFQNWCATLKDKFTVTSKGMPPTKTVDSVLSGLPRVMWTRERYCTGILYKHHKLNSSPLRDMEVQVEMSREGYLKTQTKTPLLWSCDMMYCFCIFQAIQRQLEEVAEKQRDLEERGVGIEKIIRGETGTKQHSHTD